MTIKYHVNEGFCIKDISNAVTGDVSSPEISRGQLSISTKKTEMCVCVYEAPTERDLSINSKKTKMCVCVYVCVYEAPIVRAFGRTSIQGVLYTHTYIHMHILGVFFHQI